jgi:hypothetical protein
MTGVEFAVGHLGDQLVQALGQLGHPGERLRVIGRGPLDQPAAVRPAAAWPTAAGRDVFCEGRVRQITAP